MLIKITVINVISYFVFLSISFQLDLILNHTRQKIKSTFFFKKLIEWYIHFLYSEYDSGVVTSSPYYIGASFNDTWKWIDGSLVNPILLSMYSVPAVPDNCLAWNYLDNYSEFPCGLNLPYLCEIPNWSNYIYIKCEWTYRSFEITGKFNCTYDSFRLSV